MSTIDWGYALLITGMGMGTVFLLLITLIGLLNLQTRLVSRFVTKTPATTAKSTSVKTEVHPTPDEQAAIAMALYLHFNAHDKEPSVITIEDVERRYSPWSSKIYSMRNVIK